MKRVSIFFPLTLLCIGTAAGCKERTRERESNQLDSKSAEGSRNDGKEGKPKVDRTSAKDNKELDADVVAAWMKAGAIFAWYEPNNPRSGDWRASDSKPSGPGVLPVFTMSKLEGEMISKLPKPSAPFALILSRSGCTDAELKEVAGLSSLEYLSLGQTMVTDEGLKELAGLTNLRTLYLADTQVTDLGLKEVGKLKGIQGVHLSNTKVTDAGLKELAALTSLRHLSLNDTAVTDAGLRELAKHKSLQTLIIYQTRVTDAGAAELHKALPDLRIAR
jgi:hypothetical protein